MGGSARSHCIGIGNTIILLSSVELFGPVTNQELFTYHAKDIKKP